MKLGKSLSDEGVHEDAGSGALKPRLDVELPCGRMTERINDRENKKRKKEFYKILFEIKEGNQNQSNAKTRKNFIGRQKVRQVRARN